jgi:hypothetical protein
MTQTSAHRKAGARGGNQYGEYKVRYASPRQVQFIKTLFETKQHSLSEPNWEELNVQGATELISALLKLPNKEERPRYISSKQENFLLHLVAIKEGGEQLLQASLLQEGVKDSGNLSFAIAQTLIDTLIKADVKSLKFNEAGAYRINDTIFSIRKGRQSGKWQVWSFDSLSGKWFLDSKNYGLLFEIKAENRLSLKEAIQHSALTGYCVNCGRTLTLASSVLKGMGKVCESKYS